MGEQGFLNICQEILNQKERDDRTGVGTYSMFSPQVVKYDLRNGQVPCFTTKKVAWKSAIKELLWFISGSTDSKELEEQGINWWVGNTSREFLDNIGLNDYKVGELGPMYGWNWRKAGAKYVPGMLRKEGDGHGQGGVDQLANVIEEIKTNPTSRRLVVSAYIPQDLDKGVLPPCHSFFQFYVEDGELSCILYQRSADMFLGAQINVFSYSVLTHMVAQITGLKTGWFHHHIGDAHIYKNHVEQMKVQLSREIKSQPVLVMKLRESIDDFVIEDFELVGYEPAGVIKAPMAV